MTKRRSKTPREGDQDEGSPGRKKWAPEDDATLIDMWRSHVPTAKIAEKLGRTVGALRTRASRLNLPLSMCPDAFPKGKIGRCQGCRGPFFSKMPGHRFCDPCRRNWPRGGPDEASCTFID